MRDELAEVLQDPQTVVAVEWPAIIEDVLPADHVTINIKVTNEDARQFDFSYPEKLNYLFPTND